MDEYIRDVEEKAKEAVQIVKDYRKYDAYSDNLSVVFDIDGTLLIDNKPIKPIVYLYDLCKKLGYTVFIITARDSQGISETINQLHDLNITDFKSVYFRIPTIWNIEKYKTSSRKSIVDKGYNTILSVGDTYWDVGKYGGESILLPQFGF